MRDKNKQINRVLFMTVCLNEDRWAEALTDFAEQQEGFGLPDVHCIERSDDGKRLRTLQIYLFSKV